MSNEFPGLTSVTDHELFQATTARGLDAGKTIFGRYVLIRVLGKGGMGVVWLAHDKQLEQEVAIKVLPDLVMHDSEAVRDMKGETKRSLQLNHHNIVRIYDFNQDDSLAGISMEFVDGRTLAKAKVDQPEGCFNVEDVAPWMAQICEALAYAHSTAKIVHRDLKPANIMLSNSNVIKVTDFGIARSISDSISRVSMRHASSGTMAYMSPEQSTGARSTPSDDIYALGATVYDLLTGKPPFFSGNIQHQLESITPPSMTQRREELGRNGTPIPVEWEMAIAACLEKEPSKRPSSVQDLARRLNLHVSVPMSAPALTAAPAAYERTQVDNHLEKTRPAPAYNMPQAPSGYAPPPPSPGFFTPAVVKMLGIGGGCLAGLAGIAALVYFLSPGDGTVVVATTPPGAMISIDGAQKASPAKFDDIPSGDKTVNIVLDGYDPVQLPAKVTKNKTTDLGTSTLKRSTGLAEITVIPKQAACALKLVRSPVESEQPGLVASFPATSPWKSPPLETGKYELVTTVEGFPDHTEDIEIKRNDSLHLLFDLVKDGALPQLAPEEIVAVGSDQPLPDKLRQDAAAKARLTAYYQKAFEGYLKINEFDLAASQLKRLSGELGASTTDEQKEFDEAKLIFEKGQGTLTVKTDPEGATVSLDGQKLVSPAIFKKILSGTKTLQIQLDGFDPAEVPAQITRDNLTDLGLVSLKRSTGVLEVTTIPRAANCLLALVHSPAAGESPANVATFAGPAPWKSDALGTGTYALTSNAEGFTAVTKNLEIKPGDDQKLTLDLVKENALHLLADDQIAVVANDQPLPDAMKQNPAAKTSLTAYYQQTFEGYLQLKEFKLAEAQLHHLSGDLGADPTTDQQQLDQIEAQWIAGEKTNLDQLIKQERFDAADALLTDMESHGPQPDLRASLTLAKSTHEAAVAKSLGDIAALESAGNAAGAYQAALTAADQDKNEPRLGVRVAKMELPMPSTYDRVSVRVKAMNALLANDPSLAQNQDFTGLRVVFQKNLDEHNSFQEQIAELKRQVGGIPSRIAELRAEEKHNQDKATGYKVLTLLGIGGAAAAATQNSGGGVAGGATAAAIGANGANARDADVRHIQEEIANLQNEEESGEEKIGAVRKQYEAFCESPINAINPTNTPK